MGQRRHTLTPHRSPAHHWGAELRTWRDHRRMSLAKLAVQVFYDASHLGKCERGERRPPQAIAERCDRALDSGGVLIDLWHRLFGTPDEANVRPHEARCLPDHPMASMDVSRCGDSTHLGEDVTVPARTPEGRTVLVALSRRYLLAAVSATVGAAASAWPVPSALASTGVPEDLHPVEHFQQIRRILAENDNLFGPCRVLDTAREQLAIVHRARADRRGADKRALTAVGVEFSDLIGWLYQDTGGFLAARHWLDRALEWAHLADDPTGTAFLLARKAQLAGDMGEHDQAVDLAEAAARSALLPSRFVALARTYGARGHALRGERSQCLRAYDSAHQALANSSGDELPWGQFFNSAYIEIQRANSLMALGDAPEAASILDTATQALPAGYLRDHGVYLSWQALAQASAGEPERAAVTGMRALAVGAETGSHRIATALTEVAEATSGARAVREVDELHLALARLLPEMSVA